MSRNTIIISYLWWLLSCCYFITFGYHDNVVVHSLYLPMMMTIPRRSFLIQSASSSLVAILPQSASSSSQKTVESQQQQSSRIIKPYAPLEQLLPAVRVKQRIDRALHLAELYSNNNHTQLFHPYEEWMQSLLFPPPHALLGTTPTTTANASPLNPIYRNSYQRTRAQIPLVAQPGAWLVQRGEIRAWNHLKAREQNQESENEMRAAFNTYTNALTFNAESYLWTASPDLKRQWIRQDRLPDVTAVITADLDLRYLYRNQILTAWEDARAEWQYQIKTRTQPMDLTELVDLLQQAQTACNQWFDFIDEKDVEEAMKVVDMEYRGSHHYG